MYECVGPRCLPREACGPALCRVEAVRCWAPSRRRARTGPLDCPVVLVAEGEHPHQLSAEVRQPSRIAASTPGVTPLLLIST
jgi:hypothetical protein